MQLIRIIITTVFNLSMLFYKTLEKYIYYIFKDFTRIDTIFGTFENIDLCCQSYCIFL